MGVISWIIMGALAGGLANYVMDRNNKKGCIANTIIGIIGALIGGFIVSFVGGKGITGFNIWSFIVATLGAIFFIWIVKKVSG